MCKKNLSPSYTVGETLPRGFVIIDNEYHIVENDECSETVTSDPNNLPPEIKAEKIE